MAAVDVALEGVSVSYGEVTPIRRLSLEVREGEFLALLGPSGCGKTTTLRVVAGFVVPSEGGVRVRGESMTGVPPHRRNIGMVYQDYALFPHLTVAGNVGFGLRMRRHGRGRAAEAVRAVLRQLRLDGLEARYPSELSGGQQQRVALARALVINPAVLLLDEPLAALDKKLRADMQFELKRLQRAFGITTIFVTHDQEEALSLADRLAVLNAGRILQIGTPAEVYDCPADRFVADFIGTANFFHGRIIGASGRHARVALDGGTATPVGASPVTDAPATGAPVTCAVALDDSAAGGPGGEIEFMVRPERMRLEEPSRDSTRENRIPGRVESSIYVGTGVKYRVRLASGHVVRVDTPAEAGPALPPETAVTVSFAPEDARVVTRS